MTSENVFPDLSKAEYDILSVLWQNGQQSVREDHDQLSETNKWAYSTTKTMMDRMVKKELLARESFHGVFIYKPLISKPVGLVKMVKYFADRVLELDYGSVIALFARSKLVSAEEIEELSRLLAENPEDEENE